MPELQCIAVGHQWMRGVTVVSVSINIQENVTFQTVIFLTPESLSFPLCSPYPWEKSLESFRILDICCFACLVFLLLIKEYLFSSGESSVWIRQGLPPPLRRWAGLDQWHWSPGLQLEWPLSDLSLSPQEVKAWSSWWLPHTVWREWSQQNRAEPADGQYPDDTARGFGSSCY